MYSIEDCKYTKTVRDYLQGYQSPIRDGMLWHGMLAFFAAAFV